MNKIYHSIWNEALGAWMAVSEIASGQGKRSSKRRKLLAAGLLLCTTPVWALPTGEQLVSGQATVNTPNAGQMQINQSSQNAIINWQGFSIAPNEAVNIHQPNAQAALLNRVIGQDASQIQGQLNSNGQVYLVNPNGVLFSKTAQVDVGGLVASTHNISDADFNNGIQHFTQDGATSSVDNQGTIKTTNGGVVALIGTQVSNSGTIETPQGTTILAAGKTVDLDFKGDGLVEVKVPEAALNAQINNNGAILANGGRVVLTAKAAGQLIDTVINQNGVIRAQGMIERNGEIILDGGDKGITQVSGSLDTDGQTGGNIKVTGGEVQINDGAIVTASGNVGGGMITIGDKQNTSQTSIAENASIKALALDSGTAGTIKVLANKDNGIVQVAGELNASAPKTGNGGHINTSAAQVKIADSANISTKAEQGNNGSLLIDAKNFTVDAGYGDITGAALSAALTNNNVKIQTTNSSVGDDDVGSSDIAVYDTVDWSANKLTLSADNNLYISSNLNGSDSAQLALEYGQGAVAANNSNNYFVNAVVNLPAGDNFSTKLGSNGEVTNYTVITSLGAANDTTSTSLQGINNNLAGNYVLGSDIDATETSSWTSATGAGFEPIGTKSSNFTGQLHGLGHTISSLTIDSSRTLDDVGLFGDVGNTGVLRNINLLNANVASSTDSNNAQATGALVGYNKGSISDIYLNSLGNVTGANYVGGLVGYNSGDINNVSTNNYDSITGSIKGADYVGGLVGYNTGNISNSYSDSAGTISGANYVGGLVGYNTGSLSNVSAYHYNYYTGDDTGSINAVLLSADGDTDSDSSNNDSTGSDTGTVDAVLLDNPINIMPIDELIGIHRGGIDNANLASNITGTHYVGGLVGYNAGSISGGYSDLAGGVTGTNYVGGLVGYNKGDISTTSTSSSATGADYVGGLVGYNEGNIGSTDNSYDYISAAGSVTGTNTVGGLVGYNKGNINNASATGSVTGTGNYIGGLVGENNGNISNTYASSDITGTDYVGGLVGANYATIEKSYSTGSVIATGNTVGGLVGENDNSISNAYSTSSVAGNDHVGGLVGHNAADSTINNTYATGNVEGTNNVGGLVGSNDGAVNSSFWNTESTNQASSAGGTSKTSADMKQLATFDGWSINDSYDSDSIWKLYEGDAAPALYTYLDNIIVSKGNDGIPVYSMTGEPIYTMAGNEVSSPLVINGVDDYHDVLQTNGLIFTTASGSVISPLQTSTTYLNWYQNHLADNSDYVDVNNGQLKNNPYLQSEKPANREEKQAHSDMLVNIENGGLRLPIN